VKDIPPLTKFLGWFAMAVLVVAVLVLLFGCARGPSGNPKYDRDDAECDYEGVKAAAGARDYEVPGIRADVWKRCMRLRGWK